MIMIFMNYYYVDAVMVMRWWYLSMKDNKYSVI